MILHVDGFKLSDGKVYVEKKVLEAKNGFFGLRLASRRLCIGCRIRTPLL